MKNKLIILLSITLIGLSSIACVETLIAGGIYKSSKTRQAKQSFMADFNATNVERQKAGLPPLDLCTEQYHFDKKWADNDPVCAERIAKYEGGDAGALGTPELIIAKPEPTLEPTPVPK